MHTRFLEAATTAGLGYAERSTTVHSPQPSLCPVKQMGTFRAAASARASFQDFAQRMAVFSCGALADRLKAAAKTMAARFMSRSLRIDRQTGPYSIQRRRG